MKKRYTTPRISVAQVALQRLVCASGVSSDKGIGYGGVDEGGTMDPSARRRKDVWTDE